MARYKGHNGYADVDGTAIGERTGFDINVTSNELEASTQGNDWTDTDGGQKSAAGTIDVFSDPADLGQIELVVGSTVTLNLFPQGNTTGLQQISGDFLVTEEGVSSQVGDQVKSTFSVKNKGAVTITAVA
jgi:hypothetical protein